MSKPPLLCGADFASGPDETHYVIYREECDKPGRQLTAEELRAIFGPDRIIREVAYLHIPKKQ